MVDYFQNPAYLAWAERELGVNFTFAECRWLTSLDSDGNVLGVVVFSRFTEGNCELTVVGRDKAFITKGFALAVARFVFVQCDCRRVTAIIAVGNELSLSLAQRLGFQEEGTLRSWFRDGDAKILGLLREDCKWLRILNGRPHSAAHP